MENPFKDIAVKPEDVFSETGDAEKQRMTKRDEIYSKFDPMVNDILDQFIIAHRQGIWEKGTDSFRRYCCHIAWFAGPKEKYSDPYDPHHTIRRRIEVTLDMDGFCTPTGFTVIKYDATNKVIHVGLEKDDLVRGVTEVME